MEKSSGLSLLVARESILVVSFDGLDQADR